MTKDQLWKVCVLIAIPAILWFIPPPAPITVIEAGKDPVVLALTPNAWHALAIYLAAIVGLVLKPYPAPVILLAAVGATALLIGDVRGALSGYASPTTWLVFSAFALCTAFVATGLGKRIAYILVGKLGGTTLGLGYVTAFLDLSISPVTPSNTARCGGIVFPIMNNVALAVGSEPETSAKRAGAYLMVNTYMVTKVTSIMFMTAMAPNVLAAEFMDKILGGTPGWISIDWMYWFKALFVPCFLLLLITPLLTYLLTRPDLKKVDNKKISEEGLKALGPMKANEKLLVVLFILALLGWMMPSVLEMITGHSVIKINATAVAVGVMALAFLTNVITWDDMLKSKGGWNTFIWFGGIIGLSSVLTKLDFFKWLAAFMGEHMNFGDNAMLALWIIIFASVAVRYLFASGSAYVAAMLPVFLTVGLAAGAPPVALALGLCASNSYGGALTHYGGAAAPIVFGAGYNSIKQWWIVGAIFALVAYLIMMTVGVAWWKMIGLF